jgi:hypothetical protein
MDWSFLQPIAYLAALYGFVWSMRKDSKEDYLRLEKKMDLVHEEMKDFHGRLCAIEERKKGV